MQTFVTLRGGSNEYHQVQLSQGHCSKGAGTLAPRSDGSSDLLCSWAGILYATHLIHDPKVSILASDACNFVGKTRGVGYLDVWTSAIRRSDAPDACEVLEDQSSKDHPRAP